jgi:hypothetical protein
MLSLLSEEGGDSMTATYILAEHLSIAELLETRCFIWCTGNQHHKIPITHLRVKIKDNAHAICCPLCGEAIRTVRGNKRRNSEQQELNKAIASLVNEIRYKMLAERQQKEAPAI